MEARWQRHFPEGKWILLGASCWQVGAVIIAAMAVLWSQVLYPHLLDSTVTMEAVVDAEDAAALDPTYSRWLRGLYYGEDEKLGEYALHSFNLWHVTNPAGVVEDGEYPDLTRIGPIGYVKHTNNYDVAFSQDDGRRVSYKSWHYFEPSADASDCRDMYFRMDKAAMHINAVDCTNTTCDCVTDAQNVTVVNPPFLRLLEELTPAGMLSTLAQEGFARIRNGLTGSFVFSIKTTMLPLMLADRYRQRRASLVLESVLRDVFDTIVTANGNSAAVAAVAAAPDTYGIDCAGYNLTGYASTACPFGTADAVQAAWAAAGNAGTFNLSTAQATRILGLDSTSTEGSFFDAADGAALWVAAGRYLGDLTDSEGMQPPPPGASDAEAHARLVAAMCDADGLGASSRSGNSGTGNGAWSECEVAVAGISAYLFGLWAESLEDLDALVLTEWRGGGSGGGGGDVDGSGAVVCDASGARCPWPLPGGPAGAPSVAAAAKIIDPSEADGNVVNDLSVYTTQGLNNWRDAWTYCSAPAGANCVEIASYAETATVTLPGLLAAADGALWSSLSSAENDAYISQVCNVSSWLFETWAPPGGQAWSDAAAARYLNATLWTATGGYPITNETLADVGYVQWASGAVTIALVDDLPSVAVIDRTGIWTFMDSAYQSSPPELWARAVMAGYPQAEFGVAEAKELLELLADDGDDGNAFRRAVLKASTTYVGRTGVSFIKESTDTPTYSAEFEDGDLAFMEQNFHADFASALESSSESSDSSTGGGGDSSGSGSDGVGGASAALIALLNMTYESSAVHCAEVEDMYQSCADDITNSASPWPASCALFRTIASLPDGGLVCDSSRVGLFNHPHPIKVGNVVASFLYDVAWELVLKGGGYVCSGGYGGYVPGTDDDCDHLGGGLFTKRSAYEVLFGGYMDPLVNKLLNKRIAPQNLTIRCAGDAAVTARDEQCRPTAWNEECGDAGFELVHSELGVLLTAGRNGPNRDLWHAAELPLPDNYDSLGVNGLTTVRNPVWAAFPGADWANETFRRAQDCEQRTLQGPAGLWRSCDTTVTTGRRSPSDVGRGVAFHGNATAWGGPGAAGALDIGGNGALDQMMQFEPLGFDGLGAYLGLPYGTRSTGTDASGFAAATVAAPAQLMAFAMEPVTDDAETARNVEYPTQYSYNQAATGGAAVAVSIPVNRYVQRTDDWLAAAARAAGDGYLLDWNGMPYSVPAGMATLQPLAGFAVVASDPLFYSNVAAGALDYDRFMGDVRDADLALHRSFVDVEPVTGLALRSALRMQLNFRWERSAFVPTSISNQDRCQVPTKDNLAGGYGCVMYVPLLWTDDERVADAATAARLADTFLAFPKDVRRTAWAALFSGGALVVCGLGIIVVFRLRERRFQRRVYVN
ncbi:unnamed protein product [Phaeothamnion confervicola]